MLLDFKIENYKSFLDNVVFSLVPAPKQKGLDYSILQQVIGSKKYKALCTSVIYGPNASGKSNLIGALEVFKSIVLKGNIEDKDDYTGPNFAINRLELIPNSNVGDHQVTSLSIKFIYNNLLFQYKLAIDLGRFLDDDYDREIVREQLEINENVIFTRHQSNIEFGEMNIIKDYLIKGLEGNKDSIIMLAQNNLNKKELFLMNGFKAMFSSKIVDIMRKWFEKKLTIIYRADSIEAIEDISNPKKNTVYINNIFKEALQIFGVNSNSLGYILKEDDSEPVKISIVDNKAILADIYESYGTIRFMNIFPLIVKTLLDGGTLVVDEFDASIHPMALMSLVNVFHNEEINKNNAQLIFNTHNPIFLNSNIFRRDEIKFIERDDETDSSVLYSLSDFGTSGKMGVRKNEDYMKNYFISRYGAINNIDFSPILEDLINKEEAGLSNVNKEN